MMILYSKTAEVEKAQQTEQQQGRINQQNIAADEIKNKDVKQTQVQRSEREDESARIHEQPERKRGKRLGTQAQGGGQEQQEPENEQKQDSQQKKMRLPNEPGQIDIRI